MPDGTRAGLVVVSTDDLVDVIAALAPQLGVTG
jgi:hypothetical protein